MTASIPHHRLNHLSGADRVLTTLENQLITDDDRLRIPALGAWIRRELDD